MANEMTVQKTESLSNSEAFTNKVLKEFGSNVAGSIQVTDYQRQLIQGYFIATDRALKMAEEKRVSKNENNKDHKWDNPDPINWNTVDLNALALDVVHYLNAAEASGRITARQNEHYKDLANQAIRNQKANDLMTSLNFENNTLSGTYGDLIATNQGKTQKSMGNEVDYLKNYLKNNDVQSLYDHLNTFGVDYAQQGGGWKWLQSGDQNALEKVWEAMKPDADSMRGLVDEYVKVGQDVPKQIMDKFNETMAIGAASGDTSAAWDVYAKSIADSGDKALIDAVSQMDANGQLGEEFSAAWKRATASVTDEPVELGDLKAEVDGVDIDKDAWVSSLNEKLGDLAETEDVTAEGATIKVKAGDCLWEIGNALGIDWQTIAEENGIESPYIIHAGDKRE